MTGPNLPVEDLQVCSGTRDQPRQPRRPHRGAQTRSVPAGAWTRLSGAPAARLGQGRARRPRGLCAAATRSGTVVLGSQQPRAQADQRGFGLGREVSPVTVDRPAPVLGEPPECPIRVDGMGVTGGFE